MVFSDKDAPGLLLNTPQQARAAEVANEVQKLLERLRQIRDEGLLSGRPLSLSITDLENARNRLTVWAILDKDY